MKPYDQLIRHAGNKDLFKAIEMSIAGLFNNVPLHIHAEGVRGTGKTTIMRSVKEMLPPILRIKNCIYNCHPEAPHCPEHQNLSPQDIMEIGTEFVPCPFLEISHAAKVGTVVGSVDLGKLTNRGEVRAALLPGTIPKAHRGIIFIDEINRLADTSPELADVLLDAMGTKPGHIQIEETGLPTVGFPVSVTIWAASNPDEEPGALQLIRKQLSDRFDFGVAMGRPSDYKSVVTILEQRNHKQAKIGRQESHRLVDSLNHIIIEGHIRSIIAKIYVDFRLESLRSIETMEIAGSLSALIAGREQVEVTDLINIVPLALSHRTDKGTIVAIVKYLEQLQNSSWSVESINNSLPIREIIQEVPIDEECEKIAWWRKMIANLCSKMNILNKIKPSTGYQGRGREGDVMSAGNMKLGDPGKTEFIAPPRKAVGMREIPVEEFINHEDGTSNGQE